MRSVLSAACAPLLPPIIFLTVSLVCGSSGLPLALRLTDFILGLGSLMSLEN